MKLSLYNTLTRKIEIFQPIDNQLVKMYVCGPTVYDYPHIGNARSVVVYDLLYRLLINQYGEDKVLYVRNITDVDDKIINRSKKTNEPISKLTHKTIEYFQNDMNYLGCMPPNLEPKATEHISEMINMIQLLLNNGCAYQSNNHVFFRISRAKQYTKLSGRNLDDLLDGVRIDVDKFKEHPGDFVLWKPAKEGDPDSANFRSPFGLGRPGWHIECSAMSYKYLGSAFDIHGGGIDLIFPHHTNEIAQSCCAYEGSEFAKFWIHNGFLTVDGRKMSKSLGNFKTVYDLRKEGISGDVARLFLLGSHYRSPLDYNLKAIEYAKKRLAYWYNALLAADINQGFKADMPEDFLNALLNDMNISVAFRIMNDLAKLCYTEQLSYKEKIKIAVKLVSCANFLGIMRQSPEQWLVAQQEGVDSAEINALIDKRNTLKAQKKWEEADEIREQLNKKNIVIEDISADNTTWRKK